MSTRTGSEKLTIDLRASTDYEVLRAAKVLARIDEVAREARVQKHGPSPHKFIVEGTEVDVLPYGGIERADRTIKWPDDYEMNVLGLREAVDSAQTVHLPDGISVKVPSIPALVLLKLFAWRDRHRDETRDALDLATMIEWYSSGKYFDRLYDEDSDTLEKFDFDPPPAGAWLLGAQMPGLLDDDGVAELLRVLDNHELMGRLAKDMGASRSEFLLRAMGQGVRDSVDAAKRSQSG